LSGTNLNIGVYDNGLKGVGQDARSHYGSSGSDCPWGDPRPFLLHWTIALASRNKKFLLDSAHGCAVRAGALKRGWVVQDQKNDSGWHCELCVSIVSRTKLSLLYLSLSCCWEAWLSRTARLRFGFSSSTRRQRRNSNNKSYTKTNKRKLMKTNTATTTFPRGAW